MKFVIGLLFVMSFSGAASAGDHWDECSSADANVRLSDGVLTVGDLGEVAQSPVKTKVLHTIKEGVTTCVLREGGEIATVYSNVITVEELTFALEEDGPASAITETVICQRGAGNLVRPEFCKE